MDTRVCSLLTVIVMYTGQTITTYGDTDLAC